MRTAHALIRLQLTTDSRHHLIKSYIDSQRLQLGNNSLVPLRAGIPLRRKPGQKQLLLCIHVISQHMDFLAAGACADFYTGYNSDAIFFSRLQRFGHSSYRIMIRDCHCCQPFFIGQPHILRRRLHSIRR
ncbi:hypothetical protein D3C81_1794190 [compost metagenome]